MKIFQTMLTCQVRASGHPDFYTVFSKNKPNWQLIQRQLALDLVELNDKMKEDWERTDYQELGDRRLRLAKWKLRCPKRGEITEGIDDFPVSSYGDVPSVKVREIKVI